MDNIEAGTLRSLSRTAFSGVRRLDGQEMTLSLEQSFTNSVNAGIYQVLSSKMMKFDPRFNHSNYNVCLVSVDMILLSLNGVLLNVENIGNYTRMSKVLEDLKVSRFQVSVKVCYCGHKCTKHNILLL